MDFFLVLLEKCCDGVLAAFGPLHAADVDVQVGRHDVQGAAVAGDALGRIHAAALLAGVVHHPEAVAAENTRSHFKLAQSTHIINHTQCSIDCKHEKCSW
jgi:hypothetical protein